MRHTKKYYSDSIRQEMDRIGDFLDNYKKIQEGYLIDVWVIISKAKDMLESNLRNKKKKQFKLSSLKGKVSKINAKDINKQLKSLR